MLICWRLLPWSIIPTAPKVFDKSDSLAASGFGMEVEANLEVSRWQQGPLPACQRFRFGSEGGPPDTLPHARQANMAMAQDLAREISFLLVSQLK